MNNVASILILAFLAISFIQSGYDKLFYWKDNLEWLKEHFSKTQLKNHVASALLNILVLELNFGHFMCCGLHRISHQQRTTIWLLRSYFFVYHFDHATFWTTISQRL